jgi:hypothetical protein
MVTKTIIDLMEENRKLRFALIIADLLLSKEYLSKQDRFEGIDIVRKALTEKVALEGEKNEL